MGIEDILTALEEEGRIEREKILSRAEQEAKKIIEEAETQANQIKEAQLQSMTVSLRGEQARILNDARLHKKKEIIKAKEEYIQKAFDEVRKKIENLREIKETYPDLLRGLAKETLGLVEGKVVVSVDKRDRELAKNILDELGVDYELDTELNCLGGLKITAVGGRVTHVNTLDSRLDKARQVLKSDVASILFG